MSDVFTIIHPQNNGWHIHSRCSINDRWEVLPAKPLKCYKALDIIKVQSVFFIEYPITNQKKADKILAYLT